MTIIYFFHIIFIFEVMSFVVLFHFSKLRKHFSTFPLLEKICLDCKQYVGAGINTLMSISDGLSQSIFCRNMEKARPMREEMDGNVVYFPPE